MPGKVNPVIPEIGADGGSTGDRQRCDRQCGGMSGVFELNVMMPVIAYNLLQSIEILSNASRLLADRCVAGLEANRERCGALVEESLAMVTSSGAQGGLRQGRRDRQGGLCDRSHGREVALEKAGSASRRAR